MWEGLAVHCLARNLCINCFNKILDFKTNIGSMCWERSKKKALHSCTVYTKLTALGLCDFRLFSYEHIKLHLNSIELRNTNSSYWNLRTSSMIKLKLKLFSRSDRFRNTICLSRQKIIVEETCYFFNQATKMSSHAPWVGNQQWTLAISQKILVKFRNWTFVHAFKISCERESINVSWFVCVSTRVQLMQLQIIYIYIGATILLPN